ncbi:MAG: hypothetical protein U0230_24910 [Polyangiales bacterium]
MKRSRRLPTLLALMLAMGAFGLACDVREPQRRAGTVPRNPSGKPSAAVVAAPTTGTPEAPQAVEAVEAAADPFPSRFFGEDDAAVREALRTQPVASGKRGKGGRSVGFKLTLADGTVGYFKPDQDFSGAHYWSELAAHYLDRELGFGRVAPAVGRVLEWNRLRPLMGTDSRVAEVKVRPDGTVRGAFLAWIPGGLEPLPLRPGWERWVRRDGAMIRSPFVRPAQVRDGVAAAPTAGEPDTADRAAEMSDLLIFDFLVQNVDRWGGDNTNVRTRGRGGPLVFLDNGAGFWPGIQRLPLMESRLRPLQKFRRSTIEAIRAFDRAHFEQRIARDPLAPILTERQLDGLEERCRAVLAHVEAMQARFGEAVWF